MKTAPAKIDDKYYADEYVQIGKNYAISKRMGTLSKAAAVLEVHLLRCVDTTAEDVPEVTITAEVLKQNNILHRRETIDDQVRKIARELVSFNISVFCPETNDWLETTLCSSVAKRKNKYVVKFDNNLRPFLIHMQENFAQIGVHPLFSISHSHCSYAYPLYLWLRTQIHSGSDSAYTPYTDISLLREIMGVSKKSYPRWIDFNRYVLKPVLAEINAHTDISVIIPEDGRGKSGRSITSLKFSIHRQVYQLHFDAELAAQRSENIVTIPEAVKIKLDKIGYLIRGKNYSFIKRVCETFSSETIVRSIEQLEKDVSAYFPVAKLINGCLLFHCQKVSAHKQAVKKSIEEKPNLPNKFHENKVTREELIIQTKAEEYFYQNHDRFISEAREKYKDVVPEDSETILEQLALSLAEEEFLQK